MTQISAAQPAVVGRSSPPIVSMLLATVAVAWLAAGLNRVFEAFGEATPAVSMGLRAIGAMCITLLLLDASRRAEPEFRLGLQLLASGVGLWSAAGALRSVSMYLSLIHI